MSDEHWRMGNVLRVDAGDCFYIMVLGKTDFGYRKVNTLTLNVQIIQV